MLSFRFAGAFLLRLGARTLSALLFHPPPRRTAWYGLTLACGTGTRHRRSAESNSIKYASPQAVGSGVGSVSKPALHTPVDALQAEPAPGVQLTLQAQTEDEPPGSGLA